MKNLLSICLFILSSLTVGAQQMALDQWNEEAKTNIRCLPKYGHVEKTAGQLEADTIFIQNTLTEFTSKRLASEHLIDLGFKYIYHDVKTAMYRFNQAYLLDSTNSDIYWGYGGVYMILQDYPRAKEQYEEGLLHDCYYFKEDCKNAVYYYKRCKSLGGQPLTKQFVDSLQTKCKF
jgi:hypothetical protein